MVLFRLQSFVPPPKPKIKKRLKTKEELDRAATQVLEVCPSD
jgi:hypothetical protein